MTKEQKTAYIEAIDGLKFSERNGMGKAHIPLETLRTLLRTVDELNTSLRIALNTIDELSE